MALEKGMRSRAEEDGVVSLFALRALSASPVDAPGLVLGAACYRVL